MRLLLRKIQLVLQIFDKLSFKGNLFISNDQIVWVRNGSCYNYLL